MGAQFLGLPSLRPDADGVFRVAWLTPRALARLRQDHAAPAPICLTLHHGNWDAIGGAVAGLWGEAVVYATAQHDPAADALVNAHRARLGMRVLFVGDRQAPVLGLRAVRSGSPLGLLADQGPPPRRGVPVRFLGQPTYGHSGPVFFAKRAGAALVPFVCIRRRAGRFVALAGRPLDLVGEELAAVQRGMDALSAIIARFPGQYFWQHRRFKYVSSAPPRAVEPWRRGLRWALTGAPQMDHGASERDC
jgi:KDO2-lipid IV(A) lauroyltransferase